MSLVYYSYLIVFRRLYVVLVVEHTCPSSTWVRYEPLIYIIFAYLSHVPSPLEDLRRIRPIIAFIVENFEEVFTSDLKPTVAPATVKVSTAQSILTGTLYCSLLYHSIFLLPQPCV